MVCGLLAAATPIARAGGEGGLSPTELARLQKGELVQRPVREQRGDMELMGGSSYQVIDARPEIVWQALLDTSHYDRMLPQLAEARVLSEQGDARKVFMRHTTAGLVDTSYYLDLKLDHAQRDLAFRVDESKDNGIRAAWGFYTVRPHPGGKSLLAYAVMADIGQGLGVAVVRGTVHTWMLKVPWMVKRFVEGSGRHIYH
ncbi:MAG: SRPBCC family protein [Myxococcales bacterium]|nr:SRPBCC family protein [Myxococcales bacterium]